MDSVEAEVTSAEAPTTSERVVPEDTLPKEIEVPPPASEIPMPDAPDNATSP